MLHSKKKSQRLNLKNIFQKKIKPEEGVKSLLVTFNIMISYIFPENFIEIHQVSRKI